MDPRGNSHVPFTAQGATASCPRGRDQRARDHKQQEKKKDDIFTSLLRIEREQNTVACAPSDLPIRTRKAQALTIQTRNFAAGGTNNVSARTCTCLLNAVRSSSSSDTTGKTTGVRAPRRANGSIASTNIQLASNTNRTQTVVAVGRTCSSEGPSSRLA